MIVVDIEKAFTTENGATVNISVNCNLPKITEDEKNQLLHRFSECSREIYLEIAEEINKINKTP